MANENSFCTRCGCNLAEGANFCPECGAPVPGSNGEEKMRQQSAEFQEAVVNSQANMLIFYLAVYVIPAILMAISVLVEADNIAHSLGLNASFSDWMHAHNISMDNLKDYIVYIGVIELVSGALAGVSMFLIYRRQKRIVATITCFLAAILCFWSFLGMFLGFLVTFMIYGAKACFKDEVQ